MIYDYEYFKKEIYSLTTIDLNAYKEKQMKRRIDTLIAKHKIVGYDKYVQALKTDRELFEEFVGYITINVSEFYRNPEQWKYLDETVIPELIQRFGKNLKIWSAACIQAVILLIKFNHNLFSLMPIFNQTKVLIKEVTVLAPII